MGACQKVHPQLAQNNFYGQTMKRRQAAGFSLSETHYTPGLKLSRHSHEAPYFGFILCGEYTESYGQRVRACQPSMLIYHPAGELHAQRFDQTAVRLFRIEVDYQRLQDMSQADFCLESPADYRSGLVNIIARKLYQEFCAPDAVSRLAIEGLALELIAAVARLSNHRDNTSGCPPRWLTQAHELIKSRFAEPLTLSEMARAVGVHPVTLAREFRRFYRCTIGEMARYERIEFACREILKPDAKLTDVAISAGFYDQSHFAKTFKQIMGITPAQYRANFQRC
jgi:AraC family transcriptional regulator